MSLLDKAKGFKAVKSHKLNYSNEELELVQAWVEDEISITQIAKAMKLKSTGNVYCFIARGLKQMLNDGKRRK